MSKVLNIFCVAGVLALTSCSNSDVLNENPESGSVIGFNSYVSNSSRAVANENSLFMAAINRKMRLITTPCSAA